MSKTFYSTVFLEIILPLAVVSLTGVCANSVKGFLTFKDTVNNEIVIDTVPSLKLEKIGERLYYFGAILKGNWFQAVEFCHHHDMALVSVETKEENDLLWQRLQANFGSGSYHFWTSGTILPNDQWVWLSTGTPLLYGNWFPNQPDNSGKNEKCLEVRYDLANKALKWNDNACTAMNHVICETTVPKSVSKLISNTNSCNFTLINVPAQ